MKISIIIPNYNGEELLKENFPKVITSISHGSFQVEEVIIVDDYSNDNSKEVIKTFIDQYKDRIRIFFIENEKNLGFSSSVNKGVDNATGDFVVLLNTDVVPENEFLSKALRHFGQKDVFAVGCLDKSVESGKVVFRGRGIGKWERGFLVHSRGEINKTNTLWVSGGSGIFRRSIWEKLGGFSEVYNPFYWEDIDLSYKALKSGYRIIFEPQSVVVHKHEKGAIKIKYSTFWVRVISYRNQILFVWLNITDLNLIISHVVWMPYYFLRSLVKGDITFYVGFCYVLIKLSHVVLIRNRNKKTFLKNDQDVIDMVK